MYQHARVMTVFYLVALIGIPVAAIYTYHYVFGTELFEGDELTERTCRWCGGSGTDRDLAIDLPTGGRCPACRGHGRVDVILPGPNRPVTIRGLVFSAMRVQGDASLTLQTWSPRHPLDKHPAALRDATITLTPSSGEPKTFTTADHGRFFTRLVPGPYHVEVRAKHLATVQGQLTVERLKAPIWKEKAVCGPLFGEEARSRYGMDLRVLIGRKPEDGEIQFTPTASTW